MRATSSWGIPDRAMSENLRLWSQLEGSSEGGYEGIWMPGIDWPERGAHVQHRLRGT